MQGCALLILMSYVGFSHIVEARLLMLMRTRNKVSYQECQGLFLIIYYGLSVNLSVSACFD